MASADEEFAFIELPSAPPDVPESGTHAALRTGLAEMLQLYVINVNAAELVLNPKLGAAYQQVLPRRASSGGLGRSSSSTRVEGGPLAIVASEIERSTTGTSASPSRGRPRASRRTR